jgi:NhaA family Na+:H+ antiporter
MKVKSNSLPFGGVIMWWFMLHSGIHATVTGVLLAFVIPFGNGDKDSTSSVLQHFLHKPVGFLILPLLHWQIRR